MACQGRLPAPLSRPVRWLNGGVRLNDGPRFWGGVVEREQVLEGRGFVGACCSAGPVAPLVMGLSGGREGAGETLSDALAPLICPTVRGRARVYPTVPEAVHGRSRQRLSGAWVSPERALAVSGVNASMPPVSSPGSSFAGFDSPAESGRGPREPRGLPGG